MAKGYWITIYHAVSDSAALSEDAKHAVRRSRPPVAASWHEECRPRRTRQERPSGWSFLSLTAWRRQSRPTRAAPIRLPSGF